MPAPTSTLQRSVSAYNMTQACSPILTDLHELRALQTKLTNTGNGLEAAIKMADQTESIATTKITELSTLQKLVSQVTASGNFENLCIRAAPNGTFFITTKSLRTKLGLGQHATGISRAAKHQLKTLGVNCTDISQLDRRIELAKNQLQNSVLPTKDRKVMDYTLQRINSELNEVSSAEATIKKLVCATKTKTALTLSKANTVLNAYSGESLTNVEIRDMKQLRQRLDISPSQNNILLLPHNNGNMFSLA